MVKKDNPISITINPRGTAAQTNQPRQRSRSQHRSHLRRRPQPNATGRDSRSPTNQTRPNGNPSATPVRQPRAPTQHRQPTVETVEGSLSPPFQRTTRPTDMVRDGYPPLSSTAAGLRPLTKPTHRRSSLDNVAVNAQLPPKQSQYRSPPVAYAKNSSSPPARNHHRSSTHTAVFGSRTSSRPTHQSPPLGAAAEGQELRTPTRPAHRAQSSPHATTWGLQSAPGSPSRPLTFAEVIAIGPRPASAGVSPSFTPHRVPLGATQNEIPPSHFITGGYSSPPTCYPHQCSSPWPAAQDGSCYCHHTYPGSHTLYGSPVLPHSAPPFQYPLSPSFSLSPPPNMLAPTSPSVRQNHRRDPGAGSIRNPAPKATGPSKPSLGKSTTTNSSANRTKRSPSPVWVDADNSIRGRSVKPLGETGEEWMGW